MGGVPELCGWLILIVTLFSLLSNTILPGQAQTSDKSEENRTDLLNLARRATRSAPESGSVWAIYMRLVERVTTPSSEGSESNMEEDDPFSWEEGVDGVYSFIKF